MATVYRPFLTPYLAHSERNLPSPRVNLLTAGVGSEGGVGRVGAGFVGSIQGDPRGDDTGNRAGLVRFFDFCNKNQSACISYLGIVGL